MKYYVKNILQAVIVIVIICSTVMLFSKIVLKEEEERARVSYTVKYCMILGDSGDLTEPFSERTYSGLVNEKISPDSLYRLYDKTDSDMYVYNKQKSRSCVLSDVTENVIVVAYYGVVTVDHVYYDASTDTFSEPFKTEYVVAAIGDMILSATLCDNTLSYNSQKSTNVIYERAIETHVRVAYNPTT